MRKLGISRFGSRFDKGKKLTVSHEDWDYIRAVLTTYETTDETFEEFQAMDSQDKLAIKDQGYQGIIPGIHRPEKT